ncbi:MAG: flagellar motor switch protein FliG [Chloroflexota bacterium]
MTESVLAPTAPSVPTPHLSGIQKAAALMITIGTVPAARVLAKLPPDVQEAIAAQILDTRAVPAEVRTYILEDTYSSLFAEMNDLQGGTQYALELFVEAFGEAKGLELLDKVHAARAKHPFEFLLKADDMQVAQLLTSEHPQTIAIVLAHLEPRAAAKILTLLDPAMQVEVARRIAQTGETTQDAVNVVEEGIKRRITTVVQESTQVGGTKPLAQVLNQVDRTTEKSILQELTDTDPELADEVRRFMFIFEDIGLLDDRSMQRLMKDLDTKDLALALRNVTDDLKAHFFNNMSSRAAEMLREEMSIGGQVRVKNIEEAQSRIVDVVKRLEDSDEIIINRGGEDGLI